MSPASQKQALTRIDIAAQLSLLNGDQTAAWQQVDGALQKSFRFANYYETMAFVNALAFISHQANHHPDLTVRYAACKVRFNSHDVQSISMRDFFCAAQVDKLF